MNANLTALPRVLWPLGAGALLLWIASPAPVGPRQPYLHAPSIDTYARHDPGGLTILPSGRYLKPVGIHLPLARWPHGLAMSLDGTTLFIASQGIGQFVFNRVVVVDLQRTQRVGSVPIGRYRYALALAGRQLYVATIGMFAYSPIRLPRDARFDPRGGRSPSSLPAHCR